MAWKNLLRGPHAVTIGMRGPWCARATKLWPSRCLQNSKFIVLMDMDGNQQGMADLVKLCVVHQRQHSSAQYLEALAKVADLDNKRALSRNVDVQIPVQVHASSCMHTSEQRVVTALTEIQRQEKIIKAEWEAYQQITKEVVPVRSASMRCTFVLEPMIVDLSGCTITEETAKAMEKLVLENVWASEVSVKLTMTQPNEAGEKVIFTQMMTSLFDSTRRPYDGPTMKCQSVGNVADRLQLGMVHLHCEVKLDELDLPALFSAVAVTQTTKKFSIRVYSKFYGRDTVVQFWKWIANAFFSTRAGSRSSIGSLTISDVGLLAAEEVQGFKAIMNSKHPEEELFGLKPGHTSSKEATLSAGAPIKWQFDSQGRLKANSQPLTFASPIRFVRTFHDSGKSAWVNALVPSIGRCQVRRADLEFTHAKNPRKAVPSKVASFEIRFHGFMMWSDEDYLHAMLGIIWGTTQVPENRVSIRRHGQQRGTDLDGKM